MKNNFIYSPEILKEVGEHISTENYKYVYSPKFIFLCGKGYDYNNSNTYDSTNRGVIQRYIESKDSTVRIVLAERLWENGQLNEIDLLTFEEFLAEVSDNVILFVESMGSACELGAFTFSNEHLLRKLVIVMDEEYRDGSSFINNGPIAKANKYNVPVLYSDLKGPLLGSKELTDEIDDLTQKLKCKNNNNRYMPNKTNKVKISSFIVEMLEIVRLFQPIKKEDLLFVYKSLKGFGNFDFVKKDETEFNTKIETRYVFKLLEDMDILTSNENGFSLNEEVPHENFMFTFTPLTLSIMRGKILSRKYKYKEI